MKSADRVVSQPKIRNAVYSACIILVNAALIWTIWNYKSMPVAYTFDGSWGRIAIRAPWGKAPDSQAPAFAARPGTAAIVRRAAPPIKVDAQGNPERGSSYRTYRCMVDGYPTFQETPCDNSHKSQRPPVNADQ